MANVNGEIEDLKNKLNELELTLNNISSQLHKKRETAIPVLCEKIAIKDAKLR